MDGGEKVVGASENTSQMSIIEKLRAQKGRGGQGGAHQRFK
jgi:hypothetical protein